MTTSDLSVPTTPAPRTRHSFCGDWWFRRSIDPENEWQNISLPHTYNVEDGRRGARYFRGQASYRCLLDSLPHGERLFLHFEGCNLSAEVKLSGQTIGGHKGGFTGFYVELDRNLLSPEKPAWLEVIADNSRQTDIAPIDGDFVMFGGINRPAAILATRRVCFTPTASGTEGVWITSQQTSAERAIVRWKAEMTGADPVKEKFSVRLTVRSAGGEVAAQSEYPAVFDARGVASLSEEIVIEHPILWHGLENPHRYTFTWTLWQGDQLFDEIIRPVGVRSIARDANGGIVLNGQPIRLRGVCMQQSIAVKGATFNADDFANDIRLIQEIGANAVRLAHYPHSPALFELCDRYGILVWTEIPLVNFLYKTEAFRAATLAQLREMITQLGHHAAIFAWGIFNELYASNSEQWNALLQELHETAKKLDPSRLTCCAGCAVTPVEARNVTDLLGTNAYPGWYELRPEDMGAWIEEWDASGGTRGIGLTEYGAGANPWHHEEPLTTPVVPNGFWHPEEWQAYCHERQYEAIRTSTRVWGSFVWAMFDFYSAGRNEGGLPGINDKGLVTVDRAIRKDAFFFYQAHWSDQPVLHITSKRNHFTHVAPTTLKVYANCPELTATCNGVPLSAPAVHFQVVHEFPLPPLVDGINVIEVTGLSKGKVQTDRREIYLVPPTCSQNS